MTTSRITVRTGLRIREKSRPLVRESHEGRPRISFYGRVLDELHPRRGILAALAVSVTLYGLGHAGLALAAGWLGRALASSGANDPRQWTRALISLCFIGLFAAFVKAGAGISLCFWEVSMAGRVGSRVRGRVAARLLGAGLPDAQPRVLATIAVRIRELEAAVASGFVSGIRAVAQIVPLGAALILVSPRLAIGGVALLVPVGLGVAALRRRWRASSAQAQQTTEELHAGVDELVRGLDLWRSYGAGERIERVIAELGDRATRCQARVDAARAALSGANEVLAALALLGAVALASALRLPLGDGTLVAFAAVFFMAYRPLRDLGDARAWALRGTIALEGLDAIARYEPQASEATCSHEAFELELLEVEGFGARARGPSTSFALPPGEMLCIVGPTGSGKTTLLSALLGLERSRGTLRYGGRDLSAAGVGPRERPFAWVPQDAPLVTGTIADNVTLFGGDAASALEAIGARDLLARAGDVVGPGGRPLSGGERRQVALARAIASGLPALLLDEPTEGLDPEAERRVLDALARLAGKRSLVVVTHRDNVARLASRIVPLG